MGSISKIHSNEKEILVIDFSGLKEDQMMKLISDASDLLIAENKSQLTLALFDKKIISHPDS